ncbi:MAG: dihydrodipicolinate synthase family protein [Actinomycetota bacterium]|nr:dihydrodipicolinate synthase family protein [Actinomycetota bacterium]
MDANAETGGGGQVGRLAGLYVPLLTPLRADGTVDVAAVAPHVERMLAGGVDGFVSLGTTGEFADLTGTERERVLAATLDAVGGRRPVLAGVGAVGTAQACEHARAAERAGAHAVLSLPPLYWKLDEAGLFRHFSVVASATSLPLVLYDFPSLAGVGLSPALVERLTRSLPQVVGLKASGDRLATVHGVLARVKPVRPGFRVLVGSAGFALPAMLAGADGVVAALANVTPRPLAGIVAAVAAGDLRAAARHHRRVLELAAVERLGSPTVLGLKAAAAACGSPLEPSVRTPPDDPDAVIASARGLLGALAGDAAPTG